LEAVALTVGVGITFKLTVVLAEQPKALVPTTLNIVVTPGVTVTIAPFKFPGFQVYVAAPVAVNVAVLPLQITVGFAVALIVGNGLTTTVIVVLLVHAPFVAIAVNVVVTVGVTIIEVPVNPPGFQVKLGEPLAVSVAEPPTQIAVGEATILITGAVFTVTVTAAELVQPAAEVPLTVKVVVVEIGVLTVAPTKLPGFQV
jgi:hypothetical protein